MGQERDGSEDAGDAESPDELRSDETRRLTVDPIGYVRSPMADKVDAPRQPGAAIGTQARIELLPGRNFEHALEDLASWEWIWVIFWFHLNPGWRPKVLPPRSTSGRKGVFATRSPHRPNPIGLSVVRLERVEGLIVHIRNSDMLDGTPVLDLKPYIAYSDAHPGAGTGWLEDTGRSGGSAQPSDPVSAYVVRWEGPATDQAEWIEARTGLAIRERIQSTLTLGPEPHPYRRIRRLAEGMQLSVKEWRVRFTVADRKIRVTQIDSGFRDSQLAAGDADESRLPHREFLAVWPRNRPE